MRPRCDEDRAIDAVEQLMTKQFTFDSICPSINQLQLQMFDFGCCREYRRYICSDVTNFARDLERHFISFTGCERPYCACGPVFPITATSASSSTPDIVHITLLIMAIIITVLMFVLYILMRLFRTKGKAPEDEEEPLFSK